MKATTYSAIRGLSIIAMITFLFSCGLNAQGIVIKEKVSINPQISSNALLQTEGTSSSVTFVMPYAGEAGYQITSWDSVYFGDAKLTMNGTTLIEDLAPLYDRPFIGGELGQFGEGQTLTFTMTHHDGSPWLAAKTETIVDQCGSFCDVVFSLVPIYGTPYETGDWGSWPTNICMNITCSNSEEEARRYLVSTWDQGEFVFGEPILLGAVYTGPCKNNIPVPLPEGTTFTFTITEGQEYALLHDIYSGNEGTSLSGIPQYYGIGSVRLKVIGDEPPQPIYVTVEAQTTVPGLNSCSGRFEIRPGDLKIIPTKSTIIYGDTLRFDVWKKMPDGSLGPLAPGTYFNYSIFEGYDAGYLYSPDSSWVGDIIGGDFSSAMFAALEETPQGNSTIVKISVEATEPSEPPPPCPDCFPSKISPTPPINITQLANRQTREALRPKTNSVSSQQIKLAELRGGNVPKDSLARLGKKNADGSYSYGNRNQKGSQMEPKSVNNAQQTTVKNPDGSYSILTSNRTSSQTKSSVVGLQSTESGGPLVGIATIDVVKPCILASFAKNPLSVGDTTELIFKYTETGMPIPTDKLLDVSILSGDGTGWLLSSSGKSDLTLNGIVQPIRYIAPSSIQGDSLLVYIKAVASDAGGTSGSEGVAASASLKGASILKAAKLPKGIEKIENVVLKSIKGPKGKTIQPQPFSRAMISALQEATCMEGPSGEVDGPKLVVDSLKGDDNTQKIEGTNPPKMPKPVIKVQLKNYHNKTDGTVNFHYVLKIHWKSDTISKPQWETPKNKNEQYTGDTTGTNDQTIAWQLNLDSFDMRGGNDITLIVTATTVADGKVYKTNPDSIKNPFVIKGKNPSKADLLTELAGDQYASRDQYAAISWQESRFNQFSTASSFVAHPNSTKPAYPLQGGGVGDQNDFGLMGIRFPNDNQIGNWVTNVKQGKSIFANSVTKAENYNTREYFKTRYNPTPDPLNHDTTSSDPNKDQVFLQAYCCYNCTQPNSVRYWNWVPGFPKEDKPGYWVKETKSWPDPRKHADAVFGFSIQKPWTKIK
jgi:hypothetical protein